MSTGMTDNNNQAPDTPNSTPSNVRGLDSQILINIQKSITRLEVKLEHIEKNQEKQEAKIDKIAEDVDKLRSWRATLIAGFTVGVLLIGGTLSFVGWGINKAIDLYFLQPSPTEQNHKQS